MIDLILDLVGSIPSQYEWVVGILVIVLFTFVCHVVFEVIGTFFNMFRGGNGVGRSY